MSKKMSDQEILNKAKELREEYTLALAESQGCWITYCGDKNDENKQNFLYAKMKTNAFWRKYKRFLSIHHIFVINKGYDIEFCFCVDYAEKLYSHFSDKMDMLLYMWDGENTYLSEEYAMGFREQEEITKSSFARMKKFCIEHYIINQEGKFVQLSKKDENSVNDFWREIEYRIGFRF